jgi:hypothetical protein
MDTNRLVEHVNAVLDAPPGGFKITDVYPAIATYFREMQDARSASPRSAALLQLVHVLNADPDLADLAKRAIVFPGGGIGFVPQQTAIWLLRRALRIGTVEAAQETADYLASSTVKVTPTLAIGGLAVDRVVPLADGVELVPWARLLELDDGSAAFEELSRPTFVFDQAAAALRMTLSIPKTENTAEHPNQPVQPADYSPLENAVRCLTIAGPAPVYVVGRWVALEAPIPATNSGRGWGSSTERKPDAVAVNGALAKEAAELYHAFQRLEPDYQAEIGLSADRLNQAMRRRSIVDSAIDLGIATEALFIREEDGIGEFTYKVSMRAGRLLGGSLKEREEITDFFVKLYQIRSRAVHRGRFNTRKLTDAYVGERLKLGYVYVSHALRHAIRAGKQVDWDALLLGSTPPDAQASGQEQGSKAEKSCRCWSSQ